MPVSQKENSINFQTESGNSRRTFIKKTGRLTLGLGLVGGIADQVLVSSEKSDTGKPFTVSILQTTDVHCQVHAHDELFWENGQPVFRKTGGYAHLSAYFKQQRQINPHTFAIDTGDMFQGSELSVKTTGTAMVPILNKLNYDLYLPGNWDVIYYKEAMLALLGSLQGPKICANMYHDLGNDIKGQLIFQPYYICCERPRCAIIST